MSREPAYLLDSHALLWWWFDPDWDYPDSVDRRQGSTGVSVRVLMDTCS